MLIKKKDLAPVLSELKKLYPKVIIPLKHKNAWELLMAVILSAQCTDERVNQITPHLFKAYPAAQDLAAAEIKDVEKIINRKLQTHLRSLWRPSTAKYGRAFNFARCGAQNSQCTVG